MQFTKESAQSAKEEATRFDAKSEKEFTFDLEELDGNRAMMLISPSLLAAVSPACASCAKSA